MANTNRSARNSGATRSKQSNRNNQSNSGTTAKRDFTPECLPEFTIEEAEVYKIYNGQKYDFITVKCMVNDENYQLFTIQSNVGEFDVQEGDCINVSGYITSYFNRNAKTTEYTWHAEEMQILN